MRAAAWGAAVRARPPGAPMRRSAARERGHGRENGAGAPGRSAWSWTAGGRRARWRPARWTRARPTPRTAPSCGSCCACWPRCAPGCITPCSSSARAARGPLLLQCSPPHSSCCAVHAGHARPNTFTVHAPLRAGALLAGERARRGHVALAQQRLPGPAADPGGHWPPGRPPGGRGHRGRGAARGGARAAGLQARVRARGPPTPLSRPARRAPRGPRAPLSCPTQRAPRGPRAPLSHSTRRALA